MYVDNTIHIIITIIIIIIIIIIYIYFFLNYITHSSIKLN